MAKSKSDVMGSIQDLSILSTAKTRTKEEKLIETINHQIDQFFIHMAQEKQKPVMPSDGDRGYGRTGKYFGD